MGIALFQHQVDAATEIEKRWQKHKNVCSVLPTGAGKTILKAEMARREILRGGVVVIFAHRDVLLEQISLALCAMNLPHNFYTSNKTRKNVCDLQVKEYGKSFWDERAHIFVCSVDTFYRRDISTLAPHVTLWMMDETHHLLDNSKWHRCIDPLRNARGLGVTATPIRADKKGLGRGEEIGRTEDDKPIYNNHGVFDTLISDRDIGATMHDLIQIGRLSTYRVYTPPPKVDVSNVKITSSGDYNQTQLAKATDKAEITGDAVKQYRKKAHGKQTIIFTCNIAHSEHVAKSFRGAGYNAVSVSSKTPDAERIKLVEDFRKGLITILVNCDLFGEGFDVPAVECVIMLRKTESYSLYKQQFGRMLRVIAGKEYGILIDHVGNVEHMMERYGLMYPHDDPEWSLLPQKRKSASSGLTKLNTRVCPECFARYVPSSSNQHQCPYCHHIETPAEELDALKRFQAKDVDLVELKVDVIEKLRNERKGVDRTMEEMAHRYVNQPEYIKQAGLTKHAKRLHAQSLLRDEIHSWCMALYSSGKYDKQYVQNQFSIAFKVHPMQAVVLGESEANKLREKIKNAGLPN